MTTLKIVGGHLDDSESREHRSEEREPVIGNIIWKCSADAKDRDFFEGMFIDESETGMSILTMKPVNKGAVLEIHGEGRWTGARHATVKWCSKVDSSIYRAGLTLHREA